MVKNVDDAAFDAEVLASGTPVLVEFGAEWCPPCRMLAPILEDVANNRASHLRVVTVDVDANPGHAGPIWRDVAAHAFTVRRWQTGASGDRVHVEGPAPRAR